MSQIVSARAYLSREERQQLSQKNDWLATRDLLWHYGWIAAAFALVYFFPNVLSVLVALFILGGKQLACAILMHDTSHQAVFTDQRINDFIGQWLGAYPVFNNLRAYRPYHFKHHVTNGLADDPDLLLTRGYPTTKRSMLRKFGRDLSGITGVKAFFGLILMHLGFIEFNLGGKVVKVDQRGRTLRDYGRAFVQNLLGPLVANLVLFGLLAWLAAPWLYLLWIGAYLTTFQFCLRVRAMAEHSVVDDRSDPYRNTRTTRANWLERLLFAPYHVNYHAEHHMLMSVPPYRLPQLHRLLRARRYYEKGVLAPGYWSVIKGAVKEPA
jgi:fatty acid desaturase